VITPGGERRPVEVFYSYAHEDATLRAKLDTHLAMLRRDQSMTQWHDGEIVAGSGWRQDIAKHLESADVILLLLSPDFLASDFCYIDEMGRALERERTSEATVIPIILRPCEWLHSPLAERKALPTGGRPVTAWPDRDEALHDVAQGIRTVIEAMRVRRGRAPGLRGVRRAGGGDLADAAVDRTHPEGHTEEQGLNWMGAEDWFEGPPVLGKLPSAQAIATLRELGEDTVADTLEAAEETPRKGTFGGRWNFWSARNEPWQHMAHAFGYLAPAPPGSGLLPIQHAGNITPDLSLRNSRIKITLSRLRVAGYPGRGTHRVLFDFYAQNQVPGNVEHLHFNATYRVREGEREAIVGYPIFVGLNVGSEGLSFKCFTAKRPERRG
jgi:hypothetical protein